jgi:chromosome partitioning protein
MFPTVFVVPDAIEIYDAQIKGIPISHFAPKSRAGKAYERIAKNIIEMTNAKK